MTDSARPPPDDPTWVAAARSLYDRVTPAWLTSCSDTLQAGLLTSGDEQGLSPSVCTNRWLGRRAELADGQRLLDLGCGVCGPAVDLALAWPGLRVDAVTVSPVQAELARARIASAGLGDRVTVHLADYHRLPFDDDSFDRVCFFESSGYTVDPAGLFRSVHRLLRPHGRVYIKDLFAKPGPHDVTAQAEIDAVRDLWAMARVPTLTEWSAALSDAGFRDVIAAPLPQLTSDYYWGAMFDDDLGLTPLGELFLRDLPTAGLVFYGEAHGRKG